MVEVRIVTDSVLSIGRLCDQVKADMDLERREGLEADWSGVALSLESVAEIAASAAKAAWLVYGEGVTE